MHVGMAMILRGRLQDAQDRIDELEAAIREWDALAVGVLVRGHHPEYYAACDRLRALIEGENNG